MEHLFYALTQLLGYTSSFFYIELCIEYRNYLIKPGFSAAHVMYQRKVGKEKAVPTEGTTNSLPVAH